MRSLILPIIAVSILWMVPEVVGHTRFVCPRPHSPRSFLTEGPPCGFPSHDGSPTDVMDVSSGPMTVRWEDLIMHDGAPVRIALKSRSRSETCILLDHIPQNTNQFSYTNKGPECDVGDYPLGKCRRSSYYVTVIIPDLECDDCFLQLISVDTSYLNPNDGPCYVNETSANCTVYYSCANIKIWPTPVGQGKYLNSCIEYPYNLNGPWPYAPITTFDVRGDASMAFFFNKSFTFQFNTLTYDLHLKDVNLTQIVPDSEGLYDVATGLIAKRIVRVSTTAPIYRGKQDLSDFLRRKLMNNELGIGIRTVELGLVVIALAKQSTRFESGRYLGNTLSYTSSGLLRSAKFVGRQAVYTTAVEQYGPCALPTKGLNSVFISSEAPGEVRGLMEMSHLEYNLYYTAILPVPDNISLTTEQLYLTHTRNNIFAMTTRLDVPMDVSQPRPSSRIYDGVADLVDFMMLTGGDLPDRLRATLSVLGSNTSRMLTGAVKNGLSAVVRDEWGQMTGLAIASIGERIYLDASLLLINFTNMPLVGGLYGPARPGRVGRRVLPFTHDLTVNYLGNGTWSASTKIEATSAQYIRYLWSGWFYIDIKRDFNTQHRQISGQLSKMDKWSCRNSSSIVCMVTDLTLNGQPVAATKLGRIVPMNAFVAFYPRESTLDFSIIVRCALDGADQLRNVIMITSGQQRLELDVTPMTLRPSTLESNAVEGEGRVSLDDDIRRLLEEGQFEMALYTQVYPDGEIFGVIPSIQIPTTQAGQGRTENTTRPNNTTGPALTAKDFTLECGTRADGPMTISLDGTDNTFYSIYVQNSVQTCSFLQTGQNYTLANVRGNNLADCGVQVTSGDTWVNYELMIIVQMEPSIERLIDSRFRLSCNYTGSGDVEVIVVTSSIIVTGGSSIVSRQEVIEGSVDQTYSMSVHYNNSLVSPISTVQLGEIMALKISMSGTDDDEQSLRVRRCVASDSGSREVVLLDNYCPVMRSVIYGPEGFVTDGSVAMLRSVEAFRLEGSTDGLVQLSCIIVPCSNRSACDGENCRSASVRRRRGTESISPSLVRITLVYKVVDDTAGQQRTVPGGGGNIPKDGESSGRVGSQSGTENVLLIVFGVITALLFIALVIALVACFVFRKRSQKH